MTYNLSNEKPLSKFAFQINCNVQRYNSGAAFNPFNDLYWYDFGDGGGGGCVSRIDVNHVCDTGIRVLAPYKESRTSPCFDDVAWSLPGGGGGVGGACDFTAYGHLDFGGAVYKLDSIGPID
jgi:hypothetical protein